MQRYEYRVVSAAEFKAGRQLLETEDALNALGDKGWELVHIDNTGTHTFKRKNGNSPVEDSIVAAFAGIDRALQGILGAMSKFGQSTSVGGKHKK